MDGRAAGAILRPLDPLVVRPLRRGEDAAWYAVRPRRTGAPPPFTDRADFRSEAHLLALRGGRPVGRMESILTEPHEALLVHPLVADGDDFDAVTDALVAEGVRTTAALGVRDVLMLLMDAWPRTADLRARAETWGFRPLRSKAVYRAAADSVPWGLGAVPPGLTFRPAAGEHDPRMVAALARVLVGSYESECDAATEIRTYVIRCRRDGCLHPEDWETLEGPDGLLGVVFPAFVDATHEVGTNLHVGLVPEARGRGLGTALHLRGLATTHRRGATRFLSSTDTRNIPMQRIFERVGYVRGTDQHILRLARADDA